MRAVLPSPATPVEPPSVLREALGLCRGPAFGALATEQYLEAEAARFDELQLVAFELRVDADLALGRHGELAGELQAVAAANPYRESLWRQWMLSLYRAGRQADAMRAYQQLRRTLADELGLEPGAELRAAGGGDAAAAPAARSGRAGGTGRRRCPGRRRTWRGTCRRRRRASWATARSCGVWRPTCRCGG